MKSPRWFPLLAFLLLLPLAPAEVAAQNRRPEIIAPLGDLLIFQSPAGGLWRTDGTAPGTFQIAESCTDPLHCYPIVGQAGGRVFFLVEVPELGTIYDRRYQLWATDGSPAGTRQLTALPGGLPNSYTGSQNEYLPHGYLAAPGLGLLFFRGLTPETGLELWVSDGTPEGTQLVDELSEGPADGVGPLLAEVDGRILFEGISPRRGAELWRSDGTAGGTRLVRDFLPGPTSSHPSALTRLDGRVYFTFTSPELQHELWVSDGTVDGTRPLYALEPAPPELLWHPRWTEAVAAESQVFLLAMDVEVVDDIISSYSYLVRSDGTPPGTYTLRGANLSFGALGDSVLFVSRHDQYGLSPWISDGTLQGTRLLIEPPPGESVVSSFTQVGTVAYFLTTAYEGDRYLYHLWLTDGTTQGTRSFLSLPYGETWFARGPGDHLYLTSRHEPLWRAHELWVTPAVDGSLGSATRVLDSPVLQSLTPIEWELLGAPLGDLFLFVARDSDHGTALWRSDGTPSGTYPLVVLEPPHLPGPVARLSATPVGTGTGEIMLSWQPPGPKQQYSYDIETSSPGSGGFGPYATGIRPTTITIYLEPGRPEAFRVRAWNEYGPGPWTETAATPLPAIITPCVPGEDSLCLHGSRFDVKAFYRDRIHHTWDVGHAAPLDFSDDSGAFWFFDHDNLELMVKVLDARVVNGYFWSFFGGLTTLETWITVTDTEAQTNVTFHKNANDLCGQADVSAFPRPAFEALGLADTCEPGPDHLCLTNNRYRVEVTWRDQRSGHTGVGHAIPGTEDSGFFCFFDNENVELLVKVLDATTVNGHTWVFSGSMTDVEYTLTITDTLTGEHKQYFHPPGSLCGQADVAAF